MTENSNSLNPSTWTDTELANAITLLIDEKSRREPKATTQSESGFSFDTLADVGLVNYTYRFNDGDHWELVNIEGPPATVFVDWTAKEVLELPVNEKNQKVIANLRLLMKGIRNFMTFERNHSNMPSYSDLFGNVLAYLKSQFYLPTSTDYYVAAGYDALTWFVEAVDVLGYIRIYAPTGSGKSFCMDANMDLTYHAATGVTLTEAAIARLAEYHGATIGIDEAKIRAGNSEDERGMWDLIRSRNKRGTPHIMADKDSVSGLVVQQVFGPTFIAGNKPIPYDVENRSVRLDITKNAAFRVTKSDPAPLVRQLSRLRQAVHTQVLIEKMHSGIDVVHAALLDMGFENRFADTVAPIVYFVPKAQHMELVEALRDKQLDRYNDDLSGDEAEIYRIIATFVGGQKLLQPVLVSIRDVVDRFAATKGLRWSALQQRDAASLSTIVGIVVRRLGFKSAHTASGNVVVVTAMLYQELEQRYSSVQQVTLDTQRVAGLPSFEQLLGMNPMNPLKPHKNGKKEGYDDIKTEASEALKPKIDSELSQTDSLLLSQRVQRVQDLDVKTPKKPEKSEVSEASRLQPDAPPAPGPIPSLGPGASDWIVQLRNKPPYTVILGFLRHGIVPANQPLEDVLSVFFPHNTKEQYRSSIDALYVQGDIAKNPKTAQYEIVRKDEAEEL